MLLNGLIAQTIPQKDTLPDPPLKIVPELPKDSTIAFRPPVSRPPNRDSLKAKVKYSDDALEDQVEPGKAS